VATPAPQRLERVRLRALFKHFESRRTVVEAVRGLTLDLYAGEVLALLGPNGSGKTTTIKMIAGLLAPDSGRVYVDDRDPQTDRSVLCQVGAVLEGSRNTYWRLSAEENLHYFGVLKGLTRREARTRASALLERFTLADRAATPVQQLSRGMQQKLALMVALIHQPRVLLLDEPTLGLDVESAMEMFAMIRELVAESVAVLLTTHQLDVAERIADRVAIIDRGRIALDEPIGSLLRRFSAGAYRITVDGTLDAARVARLEQAGAHVSDGVCRYGGPPDGIYEILAILRPLPLASIERDGNDLTEIFLQVIRERRRV
jgi:ABC-2 type transport system ATP-binding protein